MILFFICWIMEKPRKKRQKLSQFLNHCQAKSSTASHHFLSFYLRNLMSYKFEEKIPIQPALKAEFRSSENLYYLKYNHREYLCECISKCQPLSTLCLVLPIEFTFSKISVIQLPLRVWRPGSAKGHTFPRIRLFCEVTAYI